MSERNHNRKRDACDSGFVEEALSISVSPLTKKKKLDDSTTDSHVVDSASGGCSVTSAGEDDEQSSSLSSGCFSNEIATNNPAFVVDLEAHQKSETETETLTLVSNDFRKERNPVTLALGETTEIESSSATEKRDDRKTSPEVRKTPTPAEIEDFFSELENDDNQKRFIEKYNFDIVNDKPLEGRYKWEST
ncbi:hypothetical protein AALP_AA3G219700 [Arabis alpina]|uniref:Cyclin-dependent kinase inhibitor n=1 Tax=Arabis alpina TaxID=50452 RepID=A0A087HAU5_ARAAL|nr:hypothetical protein AALP_AA3G219700 [Arabis alpina]